MRVYYKLGMIKNEWGGLRASLFINSIAWMLLSIVCPLWIILTSKDSIDYQTTTFLFALGLTMFLVTGIHMGRHKK